MDFSEYKFQQAKGLTINSKSASIRPKYYFILTNLKG